MRGESSGSGRSSAARAYGGASADERRLRRRSALLEAVLDVVATGGVQALGVRTICTAARLNDRYFYEHFRDCDAALVALHDHLVEQATGEFLSAIATSPPEAHTRLRSVVDTAVAFVTTDPRRGRFLIESQSTVSLRDARQRLITGLAELMMTGRELLGPEAPSEKDARLIALTVLSGGVEVVSMWLRGDVDVSREDLVDFMTALILSSARLRTQLPAE